MLEAIYIKISLFIYLLLHQGCFDLHQRLLLVCLVECFSSVQVGVYSTYISNIFKYQVFFDQFPLRYSLACIPRYQGYEQYD